MAARRDVFPGVRLGIPLWWTAIQTIDAQAQRVEFEHVRGITRGMRVAWTIDRPAAGVLVVRIRHVFEPRWPVPDALVRLIVGEYFVNGVARRTLRPQRPHALACGTSVFSFPEFLYRSIVQTHRGLFQSCTTFS